MAEITLHSKLIDSTESGRFTGIKLLSVSIDGQRHDSAVSADLSFGRHPVGITVSFLLREAPRMVALDQKDSIIGDAPFPPGWFSERTFDCNTVLFDDDYRGDSEDWYGRMDVGCVIAMRQNQTLDGRNFFHRIPWIEIDGQQISDFVSVQFSEVDVANPKNGNGDICAASYVLTVEFCGYATVVYE
jgi:hypothetical protein